MYDYLLSRFSIKPKNIELYALAFQHKSVAKVNDKGFRLSNERLEFLGDSVIGTIVAEYVYNAYPNKSEGFLTQMRSRIVSRESLNRIGKKINLLEFIKYKQNRGSEHLSLLGNVFESLVGAMYLDLGYDKTKKALESSILSKYIDLKVVEETNTDYKSQLLIHCQKNHQSLSFKELNKAKIEGQFYFTMGAEIDKKIVAKATAKSKRKAEQKAAKEVLEKINQK